MGLPLVSAIAEKRAIWGPVGALFLLVGVMMRTAPTLAEDPGAGFSTTVRVDATADSAAAARDLARIDGQRRALALLVNQLSGSSDSAKLLKLDDKTITDMVESFEVANERMSAVRYLADYTFHFRPSKVRRLIHIPDNAATEATVKPAVTEGGGKPAAAESSKPLVVLPLFKDGARTVLWDDPNVWREAWEQRPADSGAIHLSLPLGDARDWEAIDAGRAEAGKSDALTAIAQRNGGDEAIVALVTTKRQGDSLVGLDLSVKRYRFGRLTDSQGATLDLNPGESEGDFLRRAADAAVVAIAGTSRRSPGPRSDQPATLAARVPISSLGEWVQVRDRLVSVPAVRKVDLLSLSRQEARIQIRYVGSSDQLKSNLAEVDLGLDGSDPEWRLRLSGATSLR
jgi:Uncharacterized protein conserved in bacteria (DUF2066)